MEKKQKIEKLCEQEGFSVEELLEKATLDSVTYGICMNEGCSYTKEVEPDQDKGYCENCNTNSVASILILTGMI
jgi:hypothetical protein